MISRCIERALLALLAVAFLATWIPARAAAPETELSICQAEASSRSERFVDQRLTQLDNCLGRISREVIRYGEDGPSAAAASRNICRTALDRLADLEDDLRSRVMNRCDPATHTFVLEEILGPSTPLIETLRVQDLDGFCGGMGGDGTIDDAGEWIDCLVATGERAVDSVLIAQYPRLLEWLAFLRVELVASVELGAIVSLDRIVDSVGVIRQGGGGAGFVGDGADASAPALAYEIGDDGKTLTDLVTGCMWERKVPGGGILTCLSNLHGADSLCNWNEATGDWIAAVNAEAYAGHSDWRVPHVKELQSIVNYGQTGPIIHPDFGPNGSFSYWSSTPLSPLIGDANFAWLVSFLNGDVNSRLKVNGLHVRAVRGCR